MKPFWDNHFFDMGQGGEDAREMFALHAGAEIREYLREIEYDIRQLKTLDAMKKIAELKEYV